MSVPSFLDKQGKLRKSAVRITIIFRIEWILVATSYQYTELPTPKRTIGVTMYITNTMPHYPLNPFVNGTNTQCTKKICT